MIEMVKEKYFLSEMSWREAKEAFKKTTVAVVPIGCVHAHADAALGIDNISIEEIAKRLAGKTNAILCPTIPYGPTESLMDYPGSIHVNGEILKNMLLDVCRSLYKWGIRKIIYLNGHGGNDYTIRKVGDQLRTELGMIGVLVDWWILISELDSKYKDVTSTTSEPAISAAMDLMDPMKARLRIHKKVTFLGDKFSKLGWRGGPYKFGKGSNIIVGMRGPERFEQPEMGEILGSKASADVGLEILEIVSDYLIGLIKEFEKIEIPPLPNKQ